MPFLPHDLVWVNGRKALIGDAADWVERVWSPSDPVVVRRDAARSGLVPVGIRGNTRGERCALWIHPDCVTRRIAPEALREQLNDAPSLPPVIAARRLQAESWPFTWGITGSCGFSLASGRCVMRPESDLDVLIRCPAPLPTSLFEAWIRIIGLCPCRVDTQMDTGRGAFSLNEWLRGDGVLIKTDRRPLLVEDPWAWEKTA